MTIEMVGILVAGIGIGWLGGCLVMLLIVKSQFGLKKKTEKEDRQ